MHASYFDMFVGGLPLAGESPREAARNEVGEELGIRNHPLEEVNSVTIGLLTVRIRFAGCTCMRASQRTLPALLTHKELEVCVFFSHRSRTHDPPSLLFMRCHNPCGEVLPSGAIKVP